jgi:tetratricopeptide (TPR) repeat protein
MDTVTYPDSRVAHFVEEDCIPVRVAVKENPDSVDEYLVSWTPHVVIADDRGRIHYRVEGYLPPQEFVARLSLGVGKFLLNEKRFAEAAGRFEGIISRHSGSAEAAEALYWLGVARYKEAKDPAQLRPSWDRLSREYPDSEWATRTRIPPSPSVS